VDKKIEHVLIELSGSYIRFDEEPLQPVRVLRFLCQKMVKPGFWGSYVTIGLF
jgi:hypothetical protein